jgi:hypothetical protein
MALALVMGDAHGLGLKLADRGRRAAAYHTAPGIDNVYSQAASCIAATVGLLSIISEYKINERAL